MFDDRTRRRLIAVQRQMLGGYLFDGTQLFITRLLDAETVVRVITLEENNPESTYEVTFRLTRMVAMTEGQSLQILNLILRRAMDGLHLETVGRNKFDADAAVSGLFAFLLFHKSNRDYNIKSIFVSIDSSAQLAFANLARLYHIDPAA